MGKARDKQPPHIKPTKPSHKPSYIGGEKAKDKQPVNSNTRQQTESQRKLNYCIFPIDVNKARTHIKRKHSESHMKLCSTFHIDVLNETRDPLKNK